MSRVQPATSITNSRIATEQKIDKTTYTVVSLRNETATETTKQNDVPVMLAEHIAHVIPAYEQQRAGALTRIVKKDGLTITVTSNIPSQAACDAFREKLFTIYQGYIDMRDTLCYNGTDDTGKRVR